MTAGVVLGALGLMALMIFIQMGRRPVRTATFLLPLAAVGYVGYRFLPAGALGAADMAAAWVGGAVGAALGVLAAAFIRVVHDEGSGRTYAQASWPYALIWVALGAGRLGFAWAATSFLREPIGRFIYAHHLTGAGVQACFVAMALATVAARTAVLALKVAAERVPARAAWGA